MSRVAFVAGGAGGMGQAICQTFASAGYRVAVADLSMDACTDVAKAIDGIAVQLELTSPDSVTAAVVQTETALGPVDICVNCAGWDEMKPFIEIDEAFMQKVLDINLAGPIRVVRAVLPGMLERQWGRIITIASDAGRVGSSLESVYSAAKGGLIAFTKTIARESARAGGVTVNNICPGPTNTPMLRGVVDASEDGARVIQAMTRAVPMRRLGTPEDIAAAVGFFASEEAGYITGQTLSVSGGLTMA